LHALIGDPTYANDVTGYAADEWWTTAPELHRLGLLTRLDVPALDCYCHAFGQWQMAAESLAKMQANDPIMNGMIIQDQVWGRGAEPVGQHCSQARCRCDPLRI